MLFLGFDIDHTLVKYKLEALHSLIQFCVTEYLQNNIFSHPYVKFDDSIRPDLEKVIERGIEILKTVPSHELGQKAIILDKHLGNLLKVDADGSVYKAFHGASRELSREEIDEHYAKKRHHFRDLDLDGEASISPKTPLVSKSSQYLVCSSYFDTPLVSIVGALIDAKDELELAEAEAISYSFICDCIIAGMMYTFVDFEQGLYFKTVAAYPERYLVKRPTVREWLETMKKSDRIKLFLMTNSLPKYTNLIMTFSYGEDWTDLFDLVIVMARKPHFFIDSQQEPVFYSVDAHSFEVGTKPIRFQDSVNSDRDNDSNVYYGGHKNELLAWIGHEDDDVVMYAGDNLITDCMYPSHVLKWKTIAVVEEALPLHSHSNEHDLDTDFSDSRDFLAKSHRIWGDFLEPKGNVWHNVLRATEFVIDDCHRLATHFIDVNNNNDNDIDSDIDILGFLESHYRTLDVLDLDCDDNSK